MTERSDLVESPFALRRVQVTFALVTLFLCARVLVIAWDASIDRQQYRSPSRVGLSGNGATFLQININAAQPRELALLPGVGPVLARRIAADREQKGPFRSVEGLCRVPGIGPKTLGRVRQFCFVEAVFGAASIANVSEPRGDEQSAKTR